MSDATPPPRRRRAPGAVSPLVGGEFAAPPPVIRDAQAHDAELPERASDAPPTWIDPQLLTDELDEGPASPPPAAQQAPRRSRRVPEAAPAAEVELPVEGDAETRRRRRRTEPEAPPAAEAGERDISPTAPEATLPLPPIGEDQVPAPLAPRRRARRVALDNSGPEAALGPAPAGPPAPPIDDAPPPAAPRMDAPEAPAPPVDDIFSSPEDVFGPAGPLAEPEPDPEVEEWDLGDEQELVEAEPVARLRRQAPASEQESEPEIDEQHRRKTLSDYLAELDEDDEDDDEDEFGIPPSLELADDPTETETAGAPRRAAPPRPAAAAMEEPDDEGLDNDGEPAGPAGRRPSRIATRLGRRRRPAGEATEEDYGISWGEEDELDAAQENHRQDAEGPAPWKPSIAVSASRGVFAAGSSLSLISPNLTQEHDELNDALAAFGSLEPGMKGFIRVTFRAYPEFKAESVNFIRSVKTGTDPNPPKGVLRSIFGLLNWSVQSLVHLVSGAAERGAPAPRPPWKGPEVREISFKDMTDDMRQSIKDAENKSRDVAFYETMLTVGVAGSPKEMAELERVRMGIEAGFEVYATPHQRLVFQEWPGYDAVIGYMPATQENALVLSAGELGEIARVPDALTRPQGVVVHRARVKPLPPTNPLIVKDPLDPESGVIPLGVIGRGTDDEKVIGMRNAEMDQHAFIVGRTGTGKAQALDTPIPTPSGWTTMGELKTGDWVFDEQGRPCRVTHAFPVMHGRPCYELVFNDGSTIVADGEHQWVTETWAARKSRSEAAGRRYSPPKPWIVPLEDIDLAGPPMSVNELVELGVPRSPILQLTCSLQPAGTREGVMVQRYGNKTIEKRRTEKLYHRGELIPALKLRACPGSAQGHKRARAAVVTTEQIRETLHATYDGRPNHAISLTAPVAYPEAELPIGPYTFGVWLGDGCMRHGTITSADPEVREEITKEGHRTSTRKTPANGCPVFGLLGIVKHLKALGVHRNKHIPDLYMRASVEQRWALLEGLMDTDGYADSRGMIEFCTVRQHLAEQVRELACSLGLVARIRSKPATLNGRITGTAYTVSFSSSRPVFRIPRKRRRQSLKGRITNRLIVDVRPVPSVPVRCIMVDSPSHQFLCGRSFIPTHNSVLMHWLIHGSIKADYPVVVVDPHGSLTEDVLNNIVRFAPERADDTVVVDFGEALWPVALNPLDIHDREQVEPTVASVKEMLARQMSLGGDSAPRAVAYVTQALSVLAEANLYLHDPETKLTLLQVPRFFMETDFRQLLMNFCSNPSVREAFDPEIGLFEQMSQKQQGEIAAPIQRAFQPLMNSRSFANSFAAGQNLLDFAKLVGQNKIILLKIPRFGGQTELGSFVGALAIPYLLQSMDAWGRKRDPKTGELVGRGVRLFIDEAPTVCGPNSSVVTVLAEARKWDLGVVAAAQFPKQLDRSVEEAFYANTASKISLALDPGGVGGMARSLAGDGKLISADDIVALPNYAAYASVLLSDPSGGKFTSGAFSMGTLPPLPDWFARAHDERPRHRLSAKEEALAERIRARSRELVCNPREEIEEKRNRILEDIRTALTQVLQDRAGELPGARDRGDDGGGFTAMDLDDGDGMGSFDWGDLD